MNTQEALAELAEFLGNLEGRVIMTRSRTALATLTALAEENERLKESSEANHLAKVEAYEKLAKAENRLREEFATSVNNAEMMREWQKKALDRT